MSNVELKRTICGVDEVGRGTLAGPVVASAVILSANHIIDGLKDFSNKGFNFSDF